MRGRCSKIKWLVSNGLVPFGVVVGHLTFTALLGSGDFDIFDGVAYSLMGTANVVPAVR
jgi:hypothetical protein